MKDLNKYIFITLLIILFYFFGNRFGKLKAKNISAEERERLNQLQQYGFSTGDINQNQLTYPQEKYHVLCAQLKRAFGLTDDIESINAVFTQMQTDADVKYLIYAYGTPRDTPNWHSGLFVRKRNLIEVVQTHLTKKQIANINQMFASKNIQYRF